MASKLTPPYGISGLWTLRSPFSAKPAKTYTCRAIRSFTELELRGIKVYQTYYQVKEISEDTYTSDASLYPNIITLIATDGERIDVPDTYIESYPDITLGDYRRFILSCDLGTMPASTATSHIASAVADVVQGKLGRAPTVNIHLGAIYDDVLTSSELEREEANRTSGITDTTTSYGQLTELNQRYGELIGYVTILEERIKTLDSGSSTEIVSLQTQIRELNTSLTEYKSEVTSLNASLIEVKAERDTLQDKVSQLETLVLQLGGSV